MTFLNFNLSQMSVSQGNPKYSNYHKFVSNLCSNISYPTSDTKAFQLKIGSYSQKELGNLRAA